MCKKEEKKTSYEVKIYLMYNNTHLNKLIHKHQEIFAQTQ